jgi:hypothetical protein
LRHGGPVAASAQKQTMEQQARDPVTAAAALPSSEALSFLELIDSEGSQLKLSNRAQQLAGHRVHINGFVAQLEIPPKGGFYLTPQPVHGDESGAGTGDLPLESILVLSDAVPANALNEVSGPVQVTGVLELGQREDSEGRSNWIRIRLDPHVL